MLCKKVFFLAYFIDQRCIKVLSDKNFLDNSSTTIGRSEIRDIRFHVTTIQTRPGKFSLFVSLAYEFISLFICLHTHAVSVSGHIHLISTL